MKRVKLTHIIQYSAYAVYNTLGAGYSEVVYGNAIHIELSKRCDHRHVICRETTIPFMYDGIPVGYGRMDFSIFNKPDKTVDIVELKAVKNLDLVAAESQLSNYYTHFSKLNTEYTHVRCCLINFSPKDGVYIKNYAIGQDGQLQELSVGTFVDD